MMRLWRLHDAPLHTMLRMFHRGLGTQAQASAETSSADSQSSKLKDALRSLYKKVHPDLFSDNVMAKNENERSFKLLQEYLEQAKSVDPRSPAARTAFAFSFYLRKPDDDKGFESVAITLPPPQGSGTLSPSVLKALARLFQACGLPAEDFIMASESGEYFWSPSGTDKRPSLRVFLPWAAEELRKQEAKKTDPSLRLANLRGAMRLGRQVLVSFPTDSDIMPSKQVELVSRLALLLDSRPDLDLKGCRVLIGDVSSGIDRLGYLCLNQDDDAEDWMGLLEQVDVPFVLDRGRVIESVKGLEAASSQALGISMIYTTPYHLPELTYRMFLEHLLDYSSTHGTVDKGSGRFSRLSVCVLPEHCRHNSVGSPIGRSLVDGCLVDDDLGIIHVTDDLNAAEVYTWIRDKIGDRAALATQVQEKRKEDEAKLIAQTRRALRLKRLMRDSRLSAKDLTSACRRLLDQADALSNVLDGCSVRIGFATRMASDGSYIEIDHDYRE